MLHGHPLLGWAATGALWILALIHLLLPFTPANPHPEAHIRVGAVVIGLVFVSLGVSARTSPRRSAIAGLLFFLLVSAVAAVTGRSPIEEGLALKLLLVAGLTAGVLGPSATDRATSKGAAPHSCRGDRVNGGTSS